MMPRDLRRLAALVVRAMEGPVDRSAGRSVRAPAVVFAEGVLQETLYGPHRRHRPEDARRVEAEIRPPEVLPDGKKVDHGKILDNGVYRFAASAAARRIVTTARSTSCGRSWCTRLTRTRTAMCGERRGTRCGCIRSSGPRTRCVTTSSRRSWMRCVRGGWSRSRDVAATVDGMYNGVRTEGDLGGKIVWFRPSADQDG